MNYRDDSMTASIRQGMSQADLEADAQTAPTSWVRAAQQGKMCVAERVGFEPTVTQAPQQFSRLPLSTTQPPLRGEYREVQSTKYKVQSTSDSVRSLYFVLPVFVLELAPLEGIEPPTPSLGRRRSIH